MSMTSLTVADFNKRACFNIATYKSENWLSNTQQKEEKKTHRLLSIMESLTLFIYDFLNCLKNI